MGGAIVRVMAEEALRESEERYRAIFEQAADSIVLFDLKTGKIIEFNDCAHENLGYTREEFGRLSLRDIEADESGSDVARHIHAIFREGGDTFETRHCNKDGEVRDVLVSARVISIRGRRLIASTWHDVTERKTAERALTAERDRAQMYLDIAGVIFVALNGKGEITLVNRMACEVLGCDEEGLLGLNWFDNFLPPDERERTRGVFRKLMAGEIDASERYENPVLTMYGEERIVSWHNTVLRDVRGNIIGTLTSGQDITERKRAEERARQRQLELAHVSRLNTMGEMASGIAHELNQPLGAIANYANGCLRRLRAGASDTQELAGAIERIAGQAERAAEIIRRLGNFVRKREPQRSSVDVNRAIREALHLVETEAKQHAIKVRTDLDARLRSVRADNVQIQQVLLNLLRNGIEAMKGGDSNDRILTIETSSSPKGDVEVTVSDTGHGFADDVVDRLFSPFFTTKPHGMGVGLSISRTIIDTHGGRLWATRNPGRGATFKFVLPGPSGANEHGN
jgi:PAS domain S-box-containing protein